jgi:hypothetical protein
VTICEDRERRHQPVLRQGRESGTLDKIGENEKKYAKNMRTAKATICEEEKHEGY